jgi:hypothetical protein
MKKAIFFLVILALSRIGVAFAADTNTTNIGNFFLNNTTFDTANVNQILGLLVGPSGPPGAAGVAGSNGFNGLNGVNGMPGAPGPMGATGPQGIQGVAGVAGPAGASGGQGPAGPQGPKGDTGPAGSGGGLTGFGGGSVSVGTCDSNVDVAFARKFSFATGRFILNSITLSKISDKCAGQTIHLYFKISNPFPTPTPAPSPSPSRNYVEGQEITCSHTLSVELNEGDDANQYSFGDESACGSVYISDIDVNDLETRIGLEIS